MSGQSVTTKDGVKAEIGIIGKLGGRKFLMAIFAIIAVALHKQFGWIDPNDILVIGGIVATYILGQSVSDGMTGGATSTTTPVTDPIEVSRIDQATEVIRNDTAKIEGKANVIAAAAGADKSPEDIASIVEAMSK